MTMRTDIQRVLTDALLHPRTIQVIHAAPGQGKTHNTVLALADVIRSGQVERVLWAVRETVKDTSLGHDAVTQLRAAGLNATLIVSKETALLKARKATFLRPAMLTPSSSAGFRAWWAARKAAGHAAHKKQFNWLPSAEVKVISHAHLPLIYGKDARTKGGPDLPKLRRAQLLIVDEDPADVFLISETVLNEARNSVSRRNLRLNHLFFEGRRDAVSQALLDLLKQATNGALDSEATLLGLPGRQQYSLTGAPFWRALTKHLPASPDWRAFAKTLGRTALFGYSSGISPWVAQQMRRSLRDFQAGHSPSAQFGLKWPYDRTGTRALNVQVRFNLSQYRRFPCSVVILDAYAHQLSYEAAFPNTPIESHRVGPHPTLQIKANPKAGRPRSDVLADKRTEHTLALMEQIVEYARTHGNTLLLCYNDVKPKYKEQLDHARTLHALPADVRVELQHWRAGRGSNEWEGWNVIALDTFAFPHQYAEHTLTALIPDATENGEQRRTALAEQHSAAEILQMFYRSRQTLAPMRPWPRTPDVISLSKLPTEGLKQLGAIDVEDQPHLLSTSIRRTTTPRLPALIAACAQELTTLLGGVPMITFAALGLVSRKDAVGHPRIDHVAGKLHVLIADSTEELPHLRGWVDQGRFPGYEQVGAKKRNSNADLIQHIQAAMPGLDRHERIYPDSALPGVKRVANTVMAASVGDAQRAVDLLFSEI